MSLPFAYTSPCIAQDPSKLTTAIVVGVNDTVDGTLEVTQVDLTDISNPRPTRLVEQINATRWSAAAERVCVLYPQGVWASGIPTLFTRQFGIKTFASDIMANGSISLPEGKQDLRTAKHFSLTGAYKDRMWFTSIAREVNTPTGSPWLVLGWNGTRAYYDFKIQRYPPADALLSVGTYPPTSGTLVPGYLTVFDATGSRGWVYKTMSGYANQAEQSLDPPAEVDMGGTVISSDALSITMVTTGYIVDKALDGSTAIYSITPSSTTAPKLMPIKPNSNVPRFMPGRTGTVFDTNKILLFGGLQDGHPTAVFHLYDTILNTWSGPDLVPPYAPESPKSSSNIGAIAGGVAGGVIVLALVLFLIIRRFRRRFHEVEVPSSKTNASKDQQASVGMEIASLSQPQPPQQLDYQFAAVYQPVIFQPQDALYAQPSTLTNPQQDIVYVQPSTHLYSPQETTYLSQGGPSPYDRAYRSPQDRVSKMILTPSTPSGSHDSASPTSTSSSPAFTDRGASWGGATTTHTTQTMVAPPPGDPQYLPSRPIAYTSF